MKKIAFIFMLTMTLMCLGSGTGVAEAEDIYMGEYHDGSVAYLDTSSIRTTNEYTNGYHDGDTHRFSVKAVYDSNGTYENVFYEIYCGQTNSMTKNGQRVWQTIHSPDPHYLDNNPVEKNLIDYFNRLTSQSWKNVPKRVR